MKKIIALLISLAVMFSVSAATMAPTADSAFAKVTSTPGVTDIRALGMGGAAVAVPDNYQSIWSNPAGLAKGKVQFSLPSVGVTVYSPLAISQKIDSSDGIDDDELVNGVLSSLTRVYGKVADVDAQLSFSAGGFGLGINVKDTLYSYVPKTSTGGISSKFYDALAFDAVVGYGLDIPVGFATIDLGVSAGISTLVYSDLIGASDFMSLMSSDDMGAAAAEKFQNIPLAAGYAIPINVGANVNLPLGFKVGAVLRNINGTYKMNQAANYAALEDPEAELEAFEIEVPMTLDAGFAWDISFLGNILHPVIAADVIDVIGLCKSNDFSVENLINHVRAGVEVKGLWIADARIGLDRGYWTAGVGLDLALLRVEAAYYWQEMGSYVGEKPQDAFSIKMNIGW